MAKEIYFDVETTGLKPGQIGQLSLIINEDGNLKGENYFFEVKYVNPDVTKKLGRDVAYYKEKSNGLKFEQKANEIYSIFDGANTIIGHNVGFDINFLTTELWRAGYQLAINNTFDTMTTYKGQIPVFDKYGRFKNPKLSEVADYLNIDYEKVEQVSNKLFAGASVKPEYHDSTYDITITMLISQLYREKNEENKTWTNFIVRKPVI